MAEADANLLAVLEAAALLQQKVPDAVLVGGSAAAYYAEHRTSFDHDHVLADLNQRFDLVLEALESTDGWVTNRVIPNKLILGEIGDIEAGVRQLIRKRPIEVAQIVLPSGHELRVPTLAETLRIKGYLLVLRNQTRDYLDVVALTETIGREAAATVLAGIDRYYGDQRLAGSGVASQLARQLSEPAPKDDRTTRELQKYKRLKPAWHDWGMVKRSCQSLADAMVRVFAASHGEGGDGGGTTFP